MSNSVNSIPFWDLGGISHEHYEAAVDTSIFYSGTQSGTLYSIDETISGLAGIYQKICSTNYQGQRVRFSVKVKARNVERRCGIGVCAGVTACPLEVALVESVSGTQDWTDLSAVIDVPEYCVYITMSLLLVECGQCGLTTLARRLSERT
jgi:AraC family transcriptional regulator